MITNKINQIKDVWPVIPAFTFYQVGSPKDLVFAYKFSEARKPNGKVIKSTQFFNVVVITSGNMTVPAGFGFFLTHAQVKDRFIRRTSHCVSVGIESSLREIGSTKRSILWEANGLSLVTYDNVTEAITDLGSIMGISLIS